MDSWTEPNGLWILLRNPIFKLSWSLGGLAMLIIFTHRWQ